MTKRKLHLDVIDEETASQAIDIVSKIADENDIDWALVGGLAMNFYGSDRLTKDIDVIANKRLPVPKETIVGQLRQGGERFQRRVKPYVRLPERTTVPVGDEQYSGMFVPFRDRSIIGPPSQGCTLRYFICHLRRQ